MTLSSNIGGSLAVGVQTMMANPLRTVLSTLGVIMGVASLVAVLAIGDGVEAFAREQIESTTDLQAVMISPVTFDVVDGVRVPRTDYPVFELDDIDRLEATLGAKSVVALILQGSARITPDSGRARAATITVTTPAAASLIRKPLLAGRFFSDAEVRDSARVAVISQGLADALAPASPATSLIGRQVTLESTKFDIIGVADNDARSTTLAAFVPATTASVALTPSVSPRTANIYVRALDIVSVPGMRKMSAEWLTSRYGNWKGRISLSGGEGMRLDQARQAILIFKVVMGAFAAVCIATGLAFGTYPALRASRLSPVEAMRHE